MSDTVSLPGSEGADAVEASYADRIDDLEGSTVAFVDWGKPNGEELYECLRDLLVGEFDAEAVEYFRKPSPSSPIPSDLFEGVMAADPDGVILAIADCGSCNTSVVVDAISFEEENVPTVQIITDAFLDLNGKVSESHGYEHLPLIAVDHPTRYLDGEEVAEMARDVVWTVDTALTCEECLRAEIGGDAPEGTGAAE